ncbi:hypothetical protein L835_4837 [Mycobacteroides abscessus MAB_110811_1470]|nr:hypothetical protein L835_4837 [Mycobacteroides abscessus MAB_110811_1470]
MRRRRLETKAARELFYLSRWLMPHWTMVRARLPPSLMSVDGE